MASTKVSRDKFGNILKHPERTCKECKLYPCFPEIEICLSDFSKYGCIYYEARNSSSRVSGKGK